jgi:Fur family transcriptional regulator, iron response regulator
MQQSIPLAADALVRARLHSRGIGCTAQRLLVGRVLFARDQHLSADAVLAALRRAGARISKATVYNTLNLFAEQGLVRALRVGADRMVFDSNTSEHHHFHDLETGELVDIAPHEVEFLRLPALPAGSESVGVEVIIRTRRALS